jgi:hypothetical protein
MTHIFDAVGSRTIQDIPIQWFTSEPRAIWVTFAYSGSRILAPGAQSVLAVAGSKGALPQARRYPQFKHLHLWDQLILFY